ncbi:MAG TPA: type IV pilin protein [Vicinamibacterales bacterium]|nr:type IV pilin protein [Vicinamibacterales bacterium]
MRQFAIVVALAVQATACTSQSAPPQQQIDVVGIKSELLAIGQAERQYFVAHSTYGSLDDLEQDRLLTGGANRRGYVFAVQADGSQGFTVTATPQDPDKQNWPTLTVDQTMQVTQR